MLRIHKDNVWQVFRIGQGVKCSQPEVHIQSNTSESDISVALDDAFHEWASLGTTIREISE